MNKRNLLRREDPPKSFQRGAGGDQLKKLFNAAAIGLLCFSLGTLPAEAGCQPGNPNSLAYIRRDNNRCEGLQEEKAAAPFKFVSFSTGNLTNTYPNSLQIRVPGTGNARPEIIIQSDYRNYYLDELAIRESPSGFTFNLPTTILKKAAIPARTLLASASIIRDSVETYFPVILGQPSVQYQFVIFSPERTTFPTFAIRRNGQIIYNQPRNNPTQNYVSLTWKYGNAPAGTYELYLVDGSGKTRNFRFQHNPNWF